ncbi:hypothetical protein [Albimonas pacifica]|uniref:Uncharacterized protein n=1 Tax=Albimonas pacifica TaxID=1114924 RepID=A0A1I3IRG9_9RHOB|nr:hypothetical protein [Albimonas pacifica]SFI50489.1 hypothetical protein SAMN05216258_107187 [Albimonas pacifica]
MLRGLFARVGAVLRRAPQGPRLTVEDATVQAQARLAPPPRLRVEDAQVTAEARS